MGQEGIAVEKIVSGGRGTEQSLDLPFYPPIPIQGKPWPGTTPAFFAISHGKDVCFGKPSPSIVVVSIIGKAPLVGTGLSQRIEKEPYCAVIGDSRKLFSLQIEVVYGKVAQLFRRHVQGVAVQYNEIGPFPRCECSPSILVEGKACRLYGVHTQGVKNRD